MDKMTEMSVPVFDGVLILPKELRHLDDSELPAVVVVARHALPTLQLWLLAHYIAMVVLSGASLGYLRYRRRIALHGDRGVALTVLLPAFEPLLWVLTVVSVFFLAVFVWALRWRLYETTQQPQVLIEVSYASRQFMFLLVLLFMLEPSVSPVSLRRAVVFTAVLSVYTIPIAWLVGRFTTNSNVFLIYWVVRVARALICVPYGYIIYRPPHRATPTALRQIAVFAGVYHVLHFTCNIIFRRDYVRTGFCVTYVILMWASLSPLLTWRVLQADTNHWRSLTRRVCLSQVFDSPSPLSPVSSRLPTTLHRKYLVDFAFLSAHSRIGIGTHAVIFNGELRARMPVAIKTYTPKKLSDDVIAAFAREAALGGARTKHPNIVTFYGLSFSPPTISLIMELCQGTLEEITRVESPQLLTRQQLLLRIAYMLDMARAIAYLHSFTPPLIHRDIKPANFFVNRHGRVKLSDFGASRRMPHDTLVAQDSNSCSLIKGWRRLTKQPASSMNSTYHTSMTLPFSPESPSSLVRMRTLHGTAEYIAPEVICGTSVTTFDAQAADVYALVVSLWDVLHPGRDKHAMVSASRDVLDIVVGGERPPIESSLHPVLRDLLARGWDAQPSRRPTAAEVVMTLDRVQDQLMMEFAADFRQEVIQNDSGTCQIAIVEEAHDSASSPQSFTGQWLCLQLRSLQIASNTSEALRFGSAMMDTGVLHHATHSRGFALSNELLYAFDDPHMHNYDAVVLPTSVADTPRCECRALGQSLPRCSREEDTRNNGRRIRLESIPRLPRQQQSPSLDGVEALTLDLLRNQGSI
ncbi:hypothetical protein Poli38472_013570 [Pythium oligandrum]|uniref:TKL protein kinase n=1 Tax=Pythium oligandrum TaxID=41045 RepID=A0A8K1CF93_PYTOL|nr:hypothetical protein Poli38472_013570 [Pythium oligandrum]|eukprot:TMW61107.1 hypothetical protein Poli38472_013570 [Pythium oligandrum]